MPGPSNPLNLQGRIIELLKENPGQSVRELSKQLQINRTFLSGYLKALEDQGYLRSKEVGPARIYFEAERRVEKHG